MHAVKRVQVKVSKGDIVSIERTDGKLYLYFF